MKLFNQTVLSLWSLAILAVTLFFLLPQVAGQSEDKDKLQKEVRAR